MKKWIETRQTSHGKGPEHAHNEPLYDEGQFWSLVFSGKDQDGFPPDSGGYHGDYPQKQFDSFVGAQNMFYETWKQAKLLCDPKRVVTVINQSYWNDVRKLLSQETIGRVVWEPQDRGTAPSIFLLLSYIRSHAPMATVVLWPAGHAVYPAGPLVQYMEQAFRVVQGNPKKMVVMDLKPRDYEKGQGRVIAREVAPKEIGVNSIRGVWPFVQDARENEFFAFCLNPGLGTTPFLMAKVQTLWEAGCEFLPEILTPLSQLESFVGTSREKRVINDFYRWLPRRNLFDHLLPLISDRLAVLKIPSVAQNGWLGTAHSQKEIKQMDNREIARSRQG